MYRPKLPQTVEDLYKNDIVKTIHLFLLTYFASKDLNIGLLFALIYLLIINSL